MRTLIRSVLLVCGVFAAFAVSAADLDLKDGDQSVTTLTNVDNVVNSGTEARVLTVNLTADETFAGTISGNVKLVKAGAKTLNLTGDNSYTGGTEIKGGILKASHANALGVKTATILVNSDCTKASPKQADICALAVNVQIFDYNVTFASWTNDARPTNESQEGYKSLYNFWPCYQGGSIVINGSLTGGDISIREATNAWGDIAKYDSSHENVTYKGDITCRNFYLVSRGAHCYVDGKVTAKALHMSNAVTPSPITLRHADNVIGSIDAGRYASGGGVSATKENAFGGAALFSSASATEKTAFFSLGGNSQEIDRPYMTYDTASVTPNPTSTDCRHAIYNTAGITATLTMNATASCTNDWLFHGKMNLVWNPTDAAYVITNVYRQHTMTGTIDVRKGTFAVGAGCSFLNVVTISVASGATFAIEDVSALNADAVAVALAEGATLRVPESQKLSLLSLEYNGIFVSVGEHAAGAFGIAGGTVGVKTCPTTLRTSVWTGAGDSPELTVAANWKDSANPPGLTSSGDILSFAEGGAEAVAASDAVVAGLVFNAAADFKLSGTGKVSLYDKGVQCPLLAPDEARTYEISAPLQVELPQEWILASNATVRVTGGLFATSAPSLTLRGYGNVEFVAKAGATFNGPVLFGNDDSPWGAKFLESPNVFLKGVNPIGTGRITIQGLPSNSNGRDPNLYLSNADISNPLTLKGHYAMHFVAMAGTTNVVRGAFDTSALDFAPYFDVKPGAKLTFANDIDFSLSAGRYNAMLWTVSSDQSTPCTETLELNGCVTYPYSMAFGSHFGDVWFNAASNALGGVDSKNWNCRIHCGADYAFANGTTEFRPSADQDESRMRTSTLDIHGHPQHLGSLWGGNRWARLMSTEGVAELRVNQTTDQTFLGTVEPNVTLVKEGAATLGTGSVGANVRVEAGVLALTSPAACSYRVTVLTVGPNGKVRLPAGVTRVKQLLYWNGEAYVYASAGEYGKDHATLGSLFDAASVGTLRVRQNEFDPGTFLFFR